MIPASRRGGWILAGLLALSVPVQAQAPSRFQASPEADEVVDTRNGLIWRRCPEGMEWKARACAGKPLFMPHPMAVARATEEAARTGKGWRLPTMKELSGITSVGDADPTAGVPAINPVAFPGTPPARFWTSSASGPHYFMYVGFRDGDVGENTRVTPAAIRLVRTAN